MNEEKLIDSWENCYEGGWKGQIVPEAFSHPAKFSRGLIERIYGHAIKEGWVKKGSVVLDPFGGVALGGLYAMSCGLHWVGVELEEKFVKLGEQNIELWNRQLKGWHNLGTARIVQGDSRKLKDVLREQFSMQGSCKPVKCDCLNGHSRQPEDCSLIISSPPFTEQNKYCLYNQTKGFHSYDKNEAKNRMKRDYIDGHTPGNLANMKEGDVDIVVSSPPYSDVIKRDRDQEGYAREKNKDYFQTLGSNNQSKSYGHTPGNLANLKEGKFDVMISSPPFATGDSASAQSLVNRKDKSAQWVKKNTGWSTGYGEQKGQLGSMKEGSFDLVCSSPPYSASLKCGNKEVGYAEARLKHVLGRKPSPGDQLSHVKRYSDNKNDLGNMPEGSIDAVISSPPYAEGLGHGGIKKTEIDKKKKLEGFIDLYSKNPNNIINLPEGSIEAVISSPPWENIQPFGKAIDFVVQDNRPERKGTNWQRKAIKDRPHGGYIPDYGGLQNNLGNSSGDTFWAASREIVQQCFELLKSGGHAIWVTKDYVKNKQRVPFSDRWLALCESVGFKLVCRHRAMLISLKFNKDGTTRVVERKSFFRRLAESKGSPRIDWEDVICLEKRIQRNR